MGEYLHQRDYGETLGERILVRLWETEYGDMMRRVLDNGMNEAAAAEGCYLRMSREK